MWWKYDRLSKYFSTLPIQEFETGNFSQGYKIIELYNTLTRKLTETATLESDKDIGKLEQEKPELLKKQQQLQESYTTTNEYIQNLLKEKKWIVKKIKNTLGRATAVFDLH